MITCKCGTCGVALKVSDDKAGRKGKCPKCGAGIAIPVPDRPLPAVGITIQPQGGGQTNSSSPPSQVSRRWWWACGGLIGLVLITCAAVLVWPRTEHAPGPESQARLVQPEKPSPAPTVVTENQPVQPEEPLPSPSPDAQVAQADPTPPEIPVHEPVVSPRSTTEPPSHSGEPAIPSTTGTTSQPSPSREPSPVGPSPTQDSSATRPSAVGEQIDASLTYAVVKENPEKYVGKRVQWHARNIYSNTGTEYGRQLNEYVYTVVEQERDSIIFGKPFCVSGEAPRRTVAAVTADQQTENVIRLVTGTIAGTGAVKTSAPAGLSGMQTASVEKVPRLKDVVIDVPQDGQAATPQMSATVTSAPSGDDGLRVSDVIWREGMSIHVVEETKRYSDPFVGGVKNTVETRGLQYRVHRGAVTIDNKGPTAKTFTLVIDLQTQAFLRTLCGARSYWEVMATETKPPQQKVADLETMRKQFAEAGHTEGVANLDEQIAEAKAVQSVTQGSLSVRARSLQLTVAAGASRTVFVVVGADDYNWYKSASAEKRKGLSKVGLGAKVVLSQHRAGTSSPPSSQPAMTEAARPASRPQTPQAVDSTLTCAEVGKNPAKYIGRRVRWLARLASSRTGTEYGRKVEKFVYVISRNGEFNLDEPAFCVYGETPKGPSRSDVALWVTGTIAGSGEIGTNFAGNRTVPRLKDVTTELQSVIDKK